MIKIGKKTGLKIGVSLFLGLFLGLSHLALAKAPIKVEASLSDQTVFLGDPFVLMVSISSEGNVATQDPELPEIPGVDIIGTSTAASFTSRLVPGPNGMEFEKARVLSYNYQMIAKEIGPRSIGPISVLVDGQTYKTKPLQLTVTDDAQQVAPKQKRRSANPFGQMPGVTLPDMEDEEDLFGQLLQRRAQPQDQPAYKALPKNANEAFFVTVELDKTEAFEGEQVFANWFLYTRGDITQLDRLKFPDLKGFWKEDIEPAPNLIFQQEIVNGVPYRKALLASHAIFPIKAGFAVVDEYKIRATVSLPTMAYGLAYGKPFQYTRSSDRVKINVKPLPTEEKPKDFSGAIGTYEIKALVENKVAQMGQPLPLKIRFEGEGNAKLIDLPALELPESLEMFDSKSEAKYFKSGKSYKEFEVLLMPKTVGDVEIPAMSFSYFDPSTKKYVQKFTEAILIKVMPGVAVAGQDNRMQVSKTSGEKKSYLPPLVQKYESSFGSLAERMQLWLGIYLAIVLTLAGRIVWVFELFKKKVDLKSSFKIRYKKIADLQKKNNYRQLAAECINLMNYVLGELSELGGASQDLGKIIQSLRPSLRRELGAELQSLGGEFQTLGFAPEETLGELKSPKVTAQQIKKLEQLLSRAMDLSDEGTKE